ncbi:helix-turn-helix domain-containing protein [Saccharopolyspora hordei]|uniref:Putative methionine-R-sulfoxide reductase with GAF domain n=1 Tax=Saccharopolyspora hordei TaxID=1838 RepID=A0A853ARS2_9PSEU|nr:GAF domain-containing protein [Saccharopolyspora hordei]NYI84241.1 putative methionine-R-sulfoxide reductase with GAF domain [Saccharopolyspora hordei]
MSGSGPPNGGVSVETVLALLDLASTGMPDEHDAVAELLSAEQLDAAAAAQVGQRVRELQGAVARLHRRGQELSALFSSARELAALHDVDELVSGLVRRAHDLAGTDVTYLSEFDERTRELRVRSTAGVIAPAFRRLRVPPHTGLAGKVAETRAPQWTSHYAQLRDVPHAESIDSAVQAEGLVSILGVPMVAGGHVLGVLFAANRSEHAFSPEEVALLSAFADIVAVVLQTARLLSQARDAADETQHAYAELAQHVAAMERAGQVHEELTAAVLRGGGATDVARTLGDALERPVLIVDEHHALVAASDGSAAVVDSDPVRSALAESRRSGRCTLLDPPVDGCSAAVAVLAGDLVLGGLLIGDGAVELGAVELRTIERAAQITALLTLKQDAVRYAEDRVRGELLNDVLSPDVRRHSDLAARLRARRVRPEDLRTVVVVAVAPEHRRAALRAAHALASASGLSGEVEGVVTLVLPGADPREAAALVRDRVRAGAGTDEVLAVAARPADTLGELSARFAAVRDCSRVLAALGVGSAAADADEYAPYTSMFAGDPTAALPFVDRVLGPVLRWDADRGTDLLTTLRHFVDCNASPVRAARRMEVHTNTVLQRIERITSLLGESWREPEPFFRVSVAVRLEGLRRRLRAEP